MFLYVIYLRRSLFLLLYFLVWNKPTSFAPPVHTRLYSFLGPCACDFRCTQQSLDIVNYLASQVSKLLARSFFPSLVVRQWVVAVSHNWSAGDIWTAFKLSTLANGEVSSFSRRTLANRTALCKLLTCIASVFWAHSWAGRRTLEESFIYSTSCVRRGPYMMDCWFVLCNINVPYGSQTEEVL